MGPNYEENGSTLNLYTKQWRLKKNKWAKNGIWDSES